MKFDIQNRRYVGSKYKISDNIIKLILENCKGNSFFDVFGGTGIMTRKMLNYVDHLIINDFLYSNEIAYKGFFNSKQVDMEKLESLRDIFNNEKKLEKNNENYSSINFGGKYFSSKDAYVIGEIRERLDRKSVV